MTAVGDARKRQNEQETGLGATNSPNAAPSATDVQTGAEAVEAIRARVEAATPAPWHEEPDPEFRGEHWCCVTQGDYGWVAPGQGPVYDVDSEQGKHDAEFIAHARTDIPLLLAALDESRAEVERVRRGARTLGHIVETQGRDALEASGMHHVIGEDGDGDWAVVWEVLAELRPRAERAEARAAAAESALASANATIARGLALADANDIRLGRSGAASYTGIGSAALRVALAPTTTDETGDDHA